MIDLRSHLLEGSAGGPEDFAEAVEICRQSVIDGVRTLVVVERWAAERDEPPQAFDESARKLARLQSEMGGALKLKHGFVLRYRPRLSALVERYGASISLGGGRFVLVALPALRVPDETEDVWAQLAGQGFSPIVAGPECSPYLRRNPERIESWLDIGVRLQLNAASITGAHGREAQRFAMHCVKEYPGHAVIASNAPGVGARRPSLRGAREIVARQFGKGRAHALLHENPSEILKDSVARVVAERRKPRGPSTLLQQLFRYRKAATDAV